MSTPINWISVEDRLPEPGQRVLTWRPGAWRDYCVGLHRYERDYARTKLDWWIGQGSGDNWALRDNRVTHWAPLPDGPGGEHVP